MIYDKTYWLPYLQEVHPLGTDDCLLLFLCIHFLNLFITVFALCSRSLQHMPSPQYVVSLCVGKLDSLTLQHVSGGSLANKYCTPWLRVCNGVGIVAAVFVVYTIQFLLYAVKNMNYIHWGVRTVLQIVIVGRMTGISMSLQAWQCFYPVKRFHSHNPHLTSDNCKAFSCCYSCMHPTHCIKPHYSLRIYCWLLTVDIYWTFMSLHNSTVIFFQSLHQR